MKKTKIVATISDLKCDEAFIKALVDEGVNVLRLNSAHMKDDGFDRVIANTKAISKQIAILVDTKGPEIRTTASDKPLMLKAGEKIKIVARPEDKTTEEAIAVNFSGFVADVPVGAHILIDDGLIDLLVEDKNDEALFCNIVNDGELGSRKTVNVPGVKIFLPSLSERDKKVIEYCVNHEVDFIAHSFVRDKHDILAIQEILDKHNSKIKIIAKIENQQGVDNIDEIIDVAYGVMVARGDLGIEIPQERIPSIQTHIINSCISKRKPVIVATQMLHSMINYPRPTRAEVSDVANAILQHSDAVMLSGETAYGKYPIEAVRTMTKIIEEAEASHYYHTDFKDVHDSNTNVTSYLAKQAVKSIRELGVKAIITDSYTGATARHLSAFRGKAPVYAICYNEEVSRLLALSYGIFPVYQKRIGSRRDYYIRALKNLLRLKMIDNNDLISYIGGSLDESLGANSIEINTSIDAIKYYERQNND